MRHHLQCRLKMHQGVQQQKMSSVEKELHYVRSLHASQVLPAHLCTVFLWAGPLMPLSVPLLVLPSVPFLVFSSVPFLVLLSVPFLVLSPVLLSLGSPV